MTEDTTVPTLVRLTAWVEVDGPAGYGEEEVGHLVDGALAHFNQLGRCRDIDAAVLSEETRKEYQKRARTKTQGGRG